MVVQLSTESVITVTKSGADLVAKDRRVRLMKIDRLDGQT